MVNISARRRIILPCYRLPCVKGAVDRRETEGLLIEIAEQSPLNPPFTQGGSDIVLRQRRMIIATTCLFLKKKTIITLRKQLIAVNAPQLKLRRS